MQNQFAIELDPAPLILKGYSVSLKYSPKKIPKVAFMASIYRSDFPDGMMNKTNKERGWHDLSIEPSFAAFLELYLNEQRKGFHFGPSIFLYNKSVGQNALEKRLNFKTIYPNLRLGYVWYPFRKTNLYVNPWLNLGSEIKIGNQNVLNGVEFSPNEFNYIVAFHIGYSFK
jgi:hypothetical protein